jgi:hypothetical protein
VIIYLGQFFEHYRSIPHFCSTYFPSLEYVSILTKNGLGYRLGDFFTNSSGHPAGSSQRQRVHTQTRKSTNTMPRSTVSTGRVTRLGEFSPIGGLFTLGSLCENGKNQDYYVGINFDKKRIGPHFGRFFYQTHLVTLVPRL